jgi:uncharacterized protein (DUF486 family)
VLVGREWLAEWQCKDPITQRRFVGLRDFVEGARATAFAEPARRHVLFQKPRPRAGGARAMNYVYLVTGVVWAALNLYWAIRFREYRKFLAGAFFVSWGVQLYFYFMKVSVPLAGTSFVVTPEVDFYRSCIHLVLFLLCLYFGFFSKPKGSPTSAGLDAR